MARFQVLYREAIDNVGMRRSWFDADKVILTQDGEWFHFITDDKINVRVKAHDVRVIENVTKDATED